MGEANKLPFSLFTTAHLRPRDQFEAWHESISVIFDVAPPAEHRVFRSTFGLSPSDVRGRAQATRVDARRPEPADIANGGYEEWVRQLK